MNYKEYILLTRRTRVQLSRLYLLYYFKHFLMSFFSKLNHTVYNLLSWLLK